MPEEVFETPQPTQPLKPKPTNWPKIILAAVLGFGLLTAAASAGYWYGTESANLKSQSAKPTTGSQPNPTPTTAPAADPTANWKIYKDNVYGFEVKYPPSFEMIKTPTENTPLLGGISILDTTVLEESGGTPPRSPAYRYSFVVEIYTAEEEDIGDVYKEPLVQYTGPKEFAVVETISWAEMGGKKAVRTTGSSTGGFFDIVETINKGTRVYLKEFAFSEEERGLHKRIFDQILSTFKFL